jgi:hypothetical protein
MKRAKRFSDLAILVIVVTNYTSRFSVFYCTLHLEGEEVFGSAKEPTDYPLGVNNDSHDPNHVNFYHPQTTIIATQSNIVGNVGM